MGCKVSSTVVATQKLDTYRFRAVDVVLANPAPVIEVKPVHITVYNQNSQIKTFSGAEKKKPIKSEERLNGVDIISPDLISESEFKHGLTGIARFRLSGSIKLFKGKEESKISSKGLPDIGGITPFNRSMTAGLARVGPSGGKTETLTPRYNKPCIRSRTNRSFDENQGLFETRSNAHSVRYSGKQFQDERIAEYLKSASFVTSSKLEDLKRQMHGRQILKTDKSSSSKSKADPRVGPNMRIVQFFTEPEKAQSARGPTPRRQTPTSVNILNNLSESKSMKQARISSPNQKWTALPPSTFSRLAYPSSRYSGKGFQSDSSLLDSNADGLMEDYCDEGMEDNEYLEKDQKYDQILVEAI